MGCGTHFFYTHYNVQKKTMLFYPVVINTSHRKYICIIKMYIFCRLIKIKRRE